MGGDVLRQVTQVGRIVLRSDRDDRDEIEIGEPVENRAKHLALAVVDRAKRHVYERPVVASGDPHTAIGGGARPIDGPQLLNTAEPEHGRLLEARREDVEVEVLVQPRTQSGLDAERPPDRLGRGGCSSDDSLGNGGAEAVSRVGEPPALCDERGGELGDVVDEQIGRPVLDRQVEVTRARRELDLDEELGEERRAELRPRDRIEIGMAGEQLQPRFRPEPDPQRLEALALGILRDRIRGGERNLVTGLPARLGERQQRAEVAREGPAGEQHSQARSMRALCETPRVGRLVPFAEGSGDAVPGWLTSAEEVARWAGLTEWPVPPTVFEEWHAEPGVVPFILVGAGGEPVGYGELWEDGDEAELARLVVAPEHRGQGNGRRLVEALVAEATRRGSDEVWLRVVPDNEAAIRCYVSAGFVRTSWEEEAEFNVGQRRTYQWMQHRL